MNDKNVQMTILQVLGDEYLLFIENYPDYIKLENRVNVTLPNHNQLDFYFTKQGDNLEIISDFVPKNDELLPKELVDELFEEFEEEKSPFDALSIADEHNGLRLVAYLDKGDLDEKTIKELVNYLEEPNPFVKKLMDLENTNNKGA